jgi:hypothetical protein
MHFSSVDEAHHGADVAGAGAPSPPASGFGADVACGGRLEPTTMPVPLGSGADGLTADPSGPDVGVSASPESHPAAKLDPTNTTAAADMT